MPGSEAYQAFFTQFGAIVSGTNINNLHRVLASGAVEAQEDPFDVAELFKLYEVQKYMSVTSHSWSGYNLIANLGVWRRLPDDIQRTIARHTRTYTRRQRQDSVATDRRLRAVLTRRGMVFNDADVSTFKASLGSFYPKWKAAIGTRATQLLEAQVGRLG